MRVYGALMWSLGKVLGINIIITITIRIIIITVIARIISITIIIITVIILITIIPVITKLVTILPLLHVQVFGTPEVARVYIGSFWDQQLRHEINQPLFR